MSERRFNLNNPEDLEEAHRLLLEEDNDDPQDCFDESDDSEVDNLESRSDSNTEDSVDDDLVEDDEPNDSEYYIGIVTTSTT